MTKNPVVHRTNRIIQHFDTEYGTEETKLEGWQRLCEDVGTPKEASITKCKKALNCLNINIVDFIAAKKAGQEVVHFQSRNALRQYIRNDRSSKTFPLKRAKENGFLRALLIRV